MHEALRISLQAGPVTLLGGVAFWITMLPRAGGFRKREGAAEADWWWMTWWAWISLNSWHDAATYRPSAATFNMQTSKCRRLKLDPLTTASSGLIRFYLVQQWMLPKHLKRGKLVLNLCNRSTVQLEAAIKEFGFNMLHVKYSHTKTARNQWTKLPATTTRDRKQKQKLVSRQTTH